jgi:(p)ppGpp synthase/HD superfamily hydrolase
VSDSTLTSLEKKRIALRYWLLGRGYTQAVDAMEFAQWYHCGTRKGGEPEFSHQVAIVSQLRTFEPWLLYPQETLVAGFLHDVREDYDVEDEVIRVRFGDIVADAVSCLTKEFRGERFAESSVFSSIGENAVASVVKGADRIHNHSTMVGVFTTEKMQEYTCETRTWFLPMIKTARRRFSVQEPAYEGLSLMLENQLSLLDVIIAGATA